MTNENAKTAATNGLVAIDWHAELARNQRWLRTVVFARVGEAAAVDDVLQEIAAGVLMQSNRPVDLDKVAPWLYRVAVRQALIYRRKKGRERKLLYRIIEKTPPSDCQPGELDPLAWLLADERRKMVREAIAALHRRDAEILMLKYTEDWSYRRIAEHLGASESAIESRLHRARGKLRERLASMSVVEAT